MVMLFYVHVSVLLSFVFPMVFLWFSYGFAGLDHWRGWSFRSLVPGAVGRFAPFVPLPGSYGFPNGFPMVFLIVFLWFSYGFSMVLLALTSGADGCFARWSGFPLVFLWFFYGFSVVFLWFSFGFSMVFLMDFPWFF